MHVFTNESYISEQLQRAKRLQRLGILALIISLAVSCPLALVPNIPPGLILVAYPFLLAGFPLMTMGNNQLRRLRNTPRADHLLSAELKGLSQKYTLHHHVPIDGRMINHILVGPAGLIVIETRATLGAVRCQSGPKGDRWSVRTGLLPKIGGANAQIGNPSQDLDSALGQARQLLNLAGKPDVQVKGLIVFTRQEDMEIESCSYPVVPIAETKDAVRQLLLDLETNRGGKDKLHEMLTSEDRRKINLKLGIPKPVVPAKPAPAKK